MPIKKTSKGYQWGENGKVYPTKKQAVEQAQAAYASVYKEKDDKSKKKK